MKSELRQLFLFLLAEILVGANAGITFSVVESRYAAAVWTGFCFLALGLALVFWSYRHKRWFLFGFAIVHTFVMSLPIWITRVLTRSDEPLEFILGMPGPSVHRAASALYTFLIVITILEIAAIYLKKIKR